MGIQFPTVVKMFDVFGKEILSQNVSTSNNIPIAIGIQTSTLPKGIYFVKIIWDNNKVILQKVVKD
jgi:hypothetical protein